MSDSVLTAIIASSTSSAILMAVGGIIAVLAISAVFYVVGRGEDREREQAARDAPRAGEPHVTPDGEPHATGEVSRSRLPASARRHRRR